MGERRVNISDKPTVDMSVKKWLILPVAGQSNAVGYDESPVDVKKYPVNPRLCQLGYKGNDNLKIIPLSWCAQNFQDMTTIKGANGMSGTKGIHYPLAKELLKWIPSDYGILIIPAAYGGTYTAFRNTQLYNQARANFDETQLKTTSNTINANNWMCIPVPNQGGKYEGTNPIKTIHKRLKYVLKNYPGSALLGFLWIQAESTTINAASGNSNLNAILFGYTTMFNSIVAACKLSGIKNVVGNDITHADIFTYKAPRYWAEEAPNKDIYNAIHQLYQKMLPPNNYIIPPQTDDVTNVVNGNGSTSQVRQSHYGNDIFDVIASKVSNAIQKHWIKLNANYFVIKNQHELITSWELN